jgi:hypothetical protein
MKLESTFVFYTDVRHEKADTKNNYIKIVYKLQTDDFVMDTYHSYIQACSSFWTNFIFLNTLIFLVGLQYCVILFTV